MFRILDALLVGFGLIGFMWVLGSAEESERDRASTLKHVQLAFRGGLHALDYKTAFPNLPNIFPDAKAELTQKGKQQMFELGRRIRERYGSLWNYTYNPYEHRIYSGNINRTQASGLMFAAGLFPPNQEYENFTNSGELGPWQPVPVHEDPRHSHTGTMLLGLRDECPAMWFVKQSQQYQALEKKYEDLIAFLCTNAEAPRIDLHNAFLAATSLAIYFKYNSTEFMWANTSIMERAIEYYWEVEDWLASIPEMRRLSAGWFLQVILEEIVSLRKYQSSRKMVAYSSHDDNVAALTSTLQNYLPSGFPDYGDYVAIEVHSYNGTEYIEVWRSEMANDTTEETRLYISGCSEPCTVEKFDKWARYFIPLDWNAECYGTWTQQFQNDELPGKHSMPIAALLSVNAILLILTLVGALGTCKYRRTMILRRGRKRKASETLMKDYEKIEPLF